MSRALGLSGTGAERKGEDLALSGTTLKAATVPAFARVLHACSGLGLRFRVIDDGAAPEATPHLERDGAPGGDGRLESDFEGIAVSISVIGERLIRQVTRLGSTVIEVLDATPEAMTRKRRPLPDLGSPELRALLGAHAFPLPDAPLPPGTPAALKGPLERFSRLGRALVWRPGSLGFAYGLFGPDEMVKPMRSSLLPRFTPAEGAEPVVRETWPFYRWGSLELVQIGWASEHTSYYLDQEECVWSFEPTESQIELWSGSVATFLERFARGEEDERERESELLFFPMRAPGELPAAFGAARVARRSDARASMWVSDMYTFWESAPSMGVPQVEVKARSSDDLLAVLRWARQRWGTRKMALIWMPASPAVERAAQEEGVEILDGGPSTWKPASFWEGP